MITLKKIKVGDEKLVFPGFFGFTKNGYIATFARGGSDITGSILARGLNASLYENFTDVDAIFAANPKIVDHPLPITKMTFREMRELSYAAFRCSMTRPSFQLSRVKFQSMSKTPTTLTCRER